jgi:hypothetical protein
MMSFVQLLRSHSIYGEAEVDPLAKPSFLARLRESRMRS